MTKQEIEELKEEMCDNYCKMADLASSEEELQIMCADCPLDRLKEIEGKET